MHPLRPMMWDMAPQLLGSSMAAPDLITADGGPHDTLWKMLRKVDSPAPASPWGLGKSMKGEAKRVR
jgi:hypothetical protein